VIKIASFKGMEIILGAISIIVGLVLLPLLAGFLATAKSDSNVSAVSGLTALLDLVAYGFAFGLVGFGISMIYVGLKKR